MPTHGIPGTSRAPDGADAAVVELKRPVDGGLVEELRALLQSAERGEIVGAIVLLHFPGHEYGYRSLGESELGQMLLAFEAWKFRQLAARELCCGVCGNGADPHG